MGITGVLIATVISMFVADWCTKPFVIFKKIIEADVWKYYRTYIMNTLFIVVVALVMFLLIPSGYSSLAICFLLGIAVTIINFIIMSIYYWLTKQYNFIYRFDILNIFKKVLKKNI